MRTERKPLRRFTVDEKARVDRMYKHMALELLQKGGPMLARNQFVDQTIWDLLEIVGNDARLLAAWLLWCEDRDMKGLRWPVSQFQIELDVPLACVGPDHSSIMQSTRLTLEKGGAR
jgi:hypothetical protein